MTISIDKAREGAKRILPMLRIAASLTRTEFDDNLVGLLDAVVGSDEIADALKRLLGESAPTRID